MQKELEGFTTRRFMPNNTQSAEEFMRGFIEEQLAFEREEAARRLCFHQRFFAGDCHWGKARAWVLLAKSLKLISITGGDTQAEAIASRTVNDQPDQSCELRFRLENEGKGWIICGVDLRCCCTGDEEAGEPGCPACHGTGWKDTNPAVAALLKRS